MKYISLSVPVRLFYKNLHKFAIKDKKYPLKAVYSGIATAYAESSFCGEAFHDLNNWGVHQLNLLNGRKTKKGVKKTRKPKKYLANIY